MKTLNKHWLKLLIIFGGGLVVVATALTAWSQTAPVLTIAPTGTNELLITVTNPVSSVSYELWSTPVLVGYPWTMVAVGATNQTAFTVAVGPYPDGFYQVVLDTNAIPIWKLADPNNPAAGILTVTIDSPTNGFVIQ